MGSEFPERFANDNMEPLPRSLVNHGYPLYDLSWSWYSCQDRGKILARLASQ